MTDKGHKMNCAVEEIIQLENEIVKLKSNVAKLKQKIHHYEAIVPTKPEFATRLIWLTYKG